MIENNNIDDIFKSFNNFSAKSPSDGWSQMSNKVFYNNIASSLKNITVKTHDYLWGNISKQLIWHNFLHFSYSTFNVFYVSAFILLTSLIFMFSNSTKEINSNPENNNNIANSTITRASHDNESNPAEIVKVTQINTPKVNNAKPVHENSNINPSKQKVHSGNSVSTKSVLSDSQKYQSNQNNGNSSVVKTNNNSKLTVDISNKFQPQIVLNDPEILQNNKETIKPDNDLTNFVDTFIVFDTIHFYDTLPVVQRNEIDYSKMSKGYSLSFYFSTLYGNSEFSSVNNPNLADINNSAISSSMSIEGGIDFEVSLSQRVFLRSGVGMLRLGEDFSYDQTKMKIDTTVKPTYISNQFYSYMEKPGYEIDTLNVYPVVTYIHHQDGSITTDTAWYYHVDSIEVNIKDSILTVVNDTTYETTYDTTVQHYFYEYANRYTYLQIPLIFGYKIGKGKLTCDMSGGIINEFFLNAKGKGVDFKDTYEVVDISKEFPFMKYNISLYLGCGLNYKIQDNVSVFLEGFYRRNINSAFQDNFALSKSFKKYGIKTGLKFNF